QITPMFFVNWNNGVSYNLVAQTPQYRLQTVKDVQNIPIAGGSKANPEILADVASMQRSREMAIVSHYNIRRVVDIYGAVQDRDLGGVGRDIARVGDANRPLLPRGSFLTVRGQVEPTRPSSSGLLAGLGMAVVLASLLRGGNVQAWM